jgi:hypothetical protein
MARGEELIKQLTSVIRIVRDYPQGLSILLGTAPPPTCEEICEMLNTARPPSEPTLDMDGNLLRVDGGGDFIEADIMLDSADMFNRVIDHSGGWPHINEVVRGWKERYPKSWAVIVDYVCWPESRVDGVSLASLADSNEISKNSMHKIIQSFPQRIATTVLNTPIWVSESQLSAVLDSDTG